MLGLAKANAGASSSDNAIKVFNLIRTLLLPTPIGRVEPQLGFIFAAVSYPEKRLEFIPKTGHTKAVSTQNSLPATKLSSRRPHIITPAT
jgi:hypothetical protein